MHVRYIVLYVEDLKRSATFYEELGLVLVRERHGSGPTHWSCDLGDVVLELYPRGDRPASRVRFGLELARAPTVLKDPDGNTVEIMGPAEAATGVVVLPCASLDPDLAFFTSLGFRLDTIFPADAPRVAELTGYGLRIRLEPGDPQPLTIRIDVGADERATIFGDAPGDARVSPGGVRLEPATRPRLGPLRPARGVVRGGQWGVGRASMGYRDLLPGRHGGHYVASHIRIAEGGPVPDYVHYHDVDFQMIYCLRGWVRLVYEDQGPPFILNAGDCVTQPPQIRHQVLECSDNLEVIEIGSPAEHPTHADHTTPLPNPPIDSARTRTRTRTWRGQRFLLHRAADAPLIPWRLPDSTARDTGVRASTNSLAAAKVVNLKGSSGPGRYEAPGDAGLCFFFVTGGALTLHEGWMDQVQALVAGDAFSLEPNDVVVMEPGVDGAELLEVIVMGEGG